MDKKCKKCGYEWKSRTDNPVACPRCKNYKWDEGKGVSDVKKD